MRESDADRAHISCDELPVAVRLDFSAAARTRFLGIFFHRDHRMPYEKHLEFYEKREVTYNYPTTTYYYRYSPFWRDWRWRDWKDWRDWSELRWSNWRLPEIKFSEIKWPEVKWPEVKPALPEKKVTWQSDLLSDRMLKSVTQRNDPPRNDPIVIRLTADQEAVLQEQFKRWPRVPHHADIILLAAETGLSEADVRDWYAIRLAQWRKEQGLGGSLGLH